MSETPRPDPWKDVKAFRVPGSFPLYVASEVDAARAADAAERDAAQQQIATLTEALHQARLQLEYLNGKFQPTGTTAGVLAQIGAALSSSTRPQKDSPKEEGENAHAEVNVEQLREAYKASSGGRNPGPR